MYCTWKHTKCRKSKATISTLKNRPIEKLSFIDLMINSKLFFIDYSSLRAGFMLKGLQNCNSHFLGRGREKSLQKCKMQCQHFPLSHSLVLENVLLNSVPSIYYIYTHTLKIITS